MGRKKTRGQDSRPLSRSRPGNVKSQGFQWWFLSVGKPGRVPGKHPPKCRDIHPNGILISATPPPHPTLHSRFPGYMPPLLVRVCHHTHQTLKNVGIPKCTLKSSGIWRGLLSFLQIYRKMVLSAGVCLSFFVGSVRFYGGGEQEQSNREFIFAETIECGWCQKIGIHPP